jgi:hypothetical protein
LNPQVVEKVVVLTLEDLSLEVQAVVDQAPVMPEDIHPQKVTVVETDPKGEVAELLK